MEISQEQIIRMFERDVMSSDPQRVSISPFSDVGNGRRQGFA